MWKSKIGLKIFDMLLLEIVTFIAMLLLEIDCKIGVQKHVQHITLSWWKILNALAFLRKRLVSAMKEFRPDVLLSWPKMPEMLTQAWVPVYL